jgi:hypothetical protein
MATAATVGDEMPRLSTLSWMTGTWIGEDKGVSMDEAWGEPRGGMLFGLHRDIDIKDDRVVSWEFLRIEERPEGVFYLASPKGAPATPFRLVESAAQRAVFWNPEHDFPKRILYWRMPDGSLHAAIDGGPGTRSVEWRWVRAR